MSANGQPGVSREGQRAVARPLDLDALGLLGLLALCALSPFGVTRAAALPLAMCAPGLAVLLALFGRRPGLRGVEVLCQSFMLSVALAIAVALALNVLGVRIERTTVLAALVLSGVGAVGVARVNDRGRAEARWMPWRSVSMPAVAASGLLVAVVLAALAARAILPSAPTDRYAALALVSPSAAVSSTLPVLDGRASVTVEIVNHRRGPRSFSIAASPRLGWPSRMVRVGAGATREVSLSGAIVPTRCPQQIQITATDRAGGKPLSVDVYTAAPVGGVCSVPQVTR